MRVFIPILFVTLAGCVHISHQDPQTGLEVNYTGSAHGAVALIGATNERPLASEAMDKGMVTSLHDADGDVRFNAGYGYTYGATSVGGYYPAGNVGDPQGNVVYVPGQGLVVSPRVWTLPPLATTVVATGVPGHATTSGAIVPCPEGRERLTVAEQAACTEQAVDALYRHRTK